MIIIASAAGVITSIGPITFPRQLRTFDFNLYNWEFPIGFWGSGISLIWSSGFGISKQITFKVLLLTFKALNNLASPYLSQLIVPYNPTKNLRSASKHLLEVPNVRLKSYGDRAFSVAAPKHWNDIPLDIKLSGSVDVFKSRLKTYLFRFAFN